MQKHPEKQCAKAILTETKRAALTAHLMTVPATAVKSIVMLQPADTTAIAFAQQTE